MTDDQALAKLEDVLDEVGMAKLLEILSKLTAEYDNPLANDPRTKEERLTQTEINTWAERGARAAYDSGNYDWDWEDVLDFVLNVARENNEAVPEFTTADLRHYKHDYARHLRVLTQLPRLWEIRRREQMLDGDGKIENWATRNFYVLDGRTDVRGEGNTLDEAIKNALGSGESQ